MFSGLHLRTCRESWGPGKAVGRLVWAEWPGARGRVRPPGGRSAQGSSGGRRRAGFPSGRRGPASRYAAFFAGVDALVIGRNTYDTVLGRGQWPYPG